MARKGFGIIIIVMIIVVAIIFLMGPDIQFRIHMDDTFNKLPEI